MVQGSKVLENIFFHIYALLATRFWLCIRPNRKRGAPRYVSISVTALNYGASGLSI